MKNSNPKDDAEQGRELFRFFTEIGIIHQLSSTLFNQTLPDDLHVSHFGVINHLVVRGDGHTPIQIAKAFQITKATMTHTLSVLQKRGFIEVRANPDDGRSKLVYLTSAGLAFREQAIAALRPAIGQLVSEIDVDELLAVLPALQKVREVLDRQRD